MSTQSTVADVIEGIAGGFEVAGGLTPGVGGIALKLLGRLGQIIATALRGGLSPDQAIEKMESAFLAKARSEAVVDAEIDRLTSKR